MKAEMRRNALRRYLVLRVKIVEFLDIGALRQELTAQRVKVLTPVGRVSSDFGDSLRTVQLSWLALLIDKNGMNAIELWRELFPKHSAQIEETWERIKPMWDVIRAFRDKAGFHADKPFAFFRARSLVVEKQEELASAIDDFQKLLRTILKAEASELPDLKQAVDDFLDELDSENKRKYDRPEFMRYLLLPSTPKASLHPKPQK
jgi:hypothetical protein